MTDELAEYRPQSSDLTINRAATDDWYDSFPNIVKLAEYVANTAFVPEQMRRDPAAIAAAILTGREMGLPPMVALRHLFVIKGRVGQSAELMRAQVYRAGHEIRYLEATDTRCVVEGRRKDEQDWTRVQFTVEDARKAQIDVRHYPADKLLARATARLARRKFPDAIMGLPVADELEDLSEPASVVGLIPDTGPPVQRKRAPRKPKAAKTQPPPANPVEPDDDDDLLDDDDDDLLDDDDIDESSRSGQPGLRGSRESRGHDPASSLSEASRELPDREPDEDLETAQTNLQAAEQLATIVSEDDDVADLLDLIPEEPEPPATKSQHAKIQAIFRDLGISARDDQLIIISHILGYDFTGSRSLLITSEANRIIDTLDRWTKDHRYPIADRINDILNDAGIAEPRDGDETP